MGKTHITWTGEELADLEEMYVNQNMTVKEIAEALHKSCPSVRGQVCVLGLHHMSWYKTHNVKYEEFEKSINMEATKRPFTFDSDLLIVQLMDEDGMDYRGVSVTLNRDREETKKHIEKMKRTGQIDKIRAYLMNSDGIYAFKMKGETAIEDR